MKTIKSILTVLAVVLTVSVFGYATAAPVADMTIGSSFISWQPHVEYKQLVLTVSCPDGSVISKTFEGYAAPNFDLSSVKGPMIEGSYTYELKVTPYVSKQVRGESYQQREALSQSGHFMVKGFSFVSPLGGSEDLAATSAVVHTADTIVDGSLCVGLDCTSVESFGSDTVRLKENNLRIHFDDTSASGSFPSNDWRITINDSSNGGGSYFSIDDATAGKTPFKVEAGAANNTLYVASSDRVGIKTSNPVVDLHIVEGNTPTLRLEQDGSSGFTPQTWDIAGNETNFFVRDVTGSSKLPFRIQPGSPENILTLRANGNVGIHTWSPDYDLEVEDSETDGKAEIVANRVNGAKTIVRGTDTQGTFGTITDHRLRLLANDTWRMELNTDNSLTMASGASCTDVGVWTNASSRELKENITDLSTEDAINTLNNLDPVTYNYKRNADEKYVGFIAEDVPEIVAQNDRKSLSTMDIVAVLTKVVKEQQKTIDELKKEIMKKDK